VVRQYALLASAVAGSAAVIVGHALTLPPELVMPALSASLVVAAAGVAAVACFVGTDRAMTRATCWDVSGALYLFGCFAGVLSEPEGVLAMMEEIRIRK
jgi:hypothetical protein